MPKGSDTIYAKSRVKAGLTVEEAVYLLPVCKRQLSRYESAKAKEHSEPTPDIVDHMIDAYNDEYLGYLYLRKNPVARRFIPEGVEQCTPLEAVVKTALALKDVMDDIDSMMKASIDGNISDDEMAKWMESKSKLREIVAGYIDIECADGNKL